MNSFNKTDSAVFVSLMCSGTCDGGILILRQRNQCLKLENILNVRLAGDYLYEKWLFTWLSLGMSLLVSCFVLSFFHEMSWMSWD